jgi:hypothetical protein
MSLSIVVNKWLIADLQGENGKEKQQQTLLFLGCIMRVLNNSSF